MTRIDIIIADEILIPLDEGDGGHLTDWNLTPYDHDDRDMEFDDADDPLDDIEVVDHDDYDPCANWTSAEIAAELARANALELPY
ncbi:MAG: hypothetical protein AAFQ17_03725 [Pseudomonadota bacterium]